MNKTEARYSQLLMGRQLAGEIKKWAFEPVRLRLADGAWYCPDFMVEMPDGRLELHETKGFMREAANVRLKVAAELHTWATFYLVKAERGRAGGFTHKLIGRGTP